VGRTKLEIRPVLEVIGGVTEIARTVLQAILVQESFHPLIEDDEVPFLARFFVYLADWWYLEVIKINGTFG